MRALGYFGAPENPATSRSSSALTSAPFDITLGVRRMAAPYLETYAAMFVDVCRRKLQSGLCQNCVR